MNKEDIWTARIKVPVRLAATAQADENFTRYKQLADMNDWNIHSALWAPVSLDGKWIKLSDRDPYDYARVERVIPGTRELRVDFDIRAAQNHHGQWMWSLWMVTARLVPVLCSTLRRPSLQRAGRDTARC
jgi:hypothetical protein